MVEIKGVKPLVPACLTPVREGIEISTSSVRTERSRRTILEMLASAVDLSQAPEIHKLIDDYRADPARFPEAQRREYPVLDDNPMFIRDYSKCILCYKCVEACGTDAQNTFAIAVAGRGFDAGISTEADVPLPESACVYCGNCIGVCPTGALMFKTEYDMRQAGAWNESEQTRTETICPYCGVGCTLTLHCQDNRIVKVTSPLDADSTNGHLCIKGRFGFEFVQNVSKPEE